MGAPRCLFGQGLLRDGAQRSDQSHRGFDFTGTLFGFTGLELPLLIDQPLRLLGQAATPLALVVLGMGLAEYGVRQGWREGLAITALKLVAQPLVVFALALLFGLPPMETQVVVLLSSLAVGINVYLMAREFNAMQSPVAASMVLSTALAAVTTPAALTLTGLTMDFSR